MRFLSLLKIGHDIFPFTYVMVHDNICEKHSQNVVGLDTKFILGLYFGNAYTMGFHPTCFIFFVFFPLNTILILFCVKEKLPNSPIYIKFEGHDWTQSRNNQELKELGWQHHFEDKCFQGETTPPPPLVLLQEHHLNAYNYKNMVSNIKFIGGTTLQDLGVYMKPFNKTIVNTTQLISPHQAPFMIEQNIIMEKGVHYMMLQIFH